MIVENNFVTWDQAVAHFKANYAVPLDLQCSSCRSRSVSEPDKYNYMKSIDRIKKHDWSAITGIAGEWMVDVDVWHPGFLDSSTKYRNAYEFNLKWRCEACDYPNRIVGMKKITMAEIAGRSPKGQSVFPSIVEKIKLFYFGGDIKDE